MSIIVFEDGIQKASPCCVGNSPTELLPEKQDVRNDNSKEIAHEREHTEQDESFLTGKKNTSQVSDMQQKSVSSDLEKTHGKRSYIYFFTFIADTI